MPIKQFDIAIIFNEAALRDEREYRRKSLLSLVFIITFSDNTFHTRYKISHMLHFQTNNTKYNYCPFKKFERRQLCINARQKFDELHLICYMHTPKKLG